jgi:cytosine/adenosine deaminase-related metal-dependent hydrolase
MAPSTILLRRGTILQHQANDDVAILKDFDLLIEGDKIAEISTDIQAPEDAEVIDCTGKLISPGMIDTHNHLWLTQAKARHAEQTLFEYIYTGNLQSYNFDPDDIYWGQLGGCLEAIDAGTTTVVDHAHLTYSTEHVNKAIAASVASGLRCFFCYVPIMRLKNWDPYTPDTDFLPTWLWQQLEHLAKTQPFGQGRVMLGFGFDMWALPKDTVIRLWTRVREWGVKLLTSHYCKNRIFGMFSPTFDQQHY